MAAKKQKSNQLEPLSKKMEETNAKREGQRKPRVIDEHVGLRLRTRRVLKNVSQEQLASKLGITFQQIQKYEKGINRISAGRLYEVAVLLGVPVSYFFETIDTLPEGDLPAEIAVCEEGGAFKGQPISREGLLQALLDRIIKIQDLNALERVLFQVERELPK